MIPLNDLLNESRDYTLKEAVEIYLEKELDEKEVKDLYCTTQNSLNETIFYSIVIEEDEILIPKTEEVSLDAKFYDKDYNLIDWQSGNYYIINNYSSPTTFNPNDSTTNYYYRVEDKFQVAYTQKQLKGLADVEI
jgi:hypothetical protein